MFRDFLHGPAVKNLSCNAADAGSIPGQVTMIPHVIRSGQKTNKIKKNQEKKILKKKKKKKEWLREDDVEWLQILRLLDYIYSSKRHPEPVFQTAYISLFGFWKQSNLDLPRNMAACFSGTPSVSHA